MYETLFLLALPVFIVVFVWITYNSLITLKMRVKEAWSDIDVQLKKRYDLLPDLIETARKATAVDEGILTKVTELRTRAMENASKGVDPKVRGVIESEISNAIKGLQVQVEAYPELKSHTELNNLMDKVTEIEEKIAYARRFYNGNVMSYNTKIKVFPNVLIANVLGFSDEKFFEAVEGEKEDIKIDFNKK